MNKFVERLKDKEFLIMTHRGSWQGNIIQNTRQATVLAYKYGTDVVEVDVRKSKDGVYYLFHNGNEPNLLKKTLDFSEISSEDIKNSSLINTTLEPSGYPVERLDDYLAWLPEDYLINLDRAYFYFDDPDFFKILEESGKTSQIFLKAPDKDDYFESLNKMDLDIPFVSVINSPESYYKILENYPNIRIIGVEYISSSKKPSEKELEFFSELKNDNKIVLANSINLGKDRNLFYGLYDDDAVLNNPDEVWGKIIDYGVNMIQTDFPYFLDQFRKNK